MNARHQFGQPAQRFRCVGTGHDVFALSIDKILAIDLAFTRERITREQHTGAGLPIGVAEHHGLNRYCRAHLVVYTVMLTITLGAAAVPGIEHRADGGMQLFARRLGHRAVTGLCDGRAPVRGHSVAIQLGDDCTQHDAREHFAKAAMGVAGKCSVAGFLGEGLFGLIVDTEIEHGVHHAGHADRCAGTYRH